MKRHSQKISVHPLTRVGSGRCSSSSSPQQQDIFKLYLKYRSFLIMFLLLLFIIIIVNNQKCRHTLPPPRWTPCWLLQLEVVISRRRSAPESVLLRASLCLTVCRVSELVHCLLLPVATRRSFVALYRCHGYLQRIIICYSNRVKFARFTRLSRPLYGTRVARPLCGGA